MLVVLCLFFPIFFIGVNIPNKQMLRSMHYFPIHATRLILFLWRIKVVVHGQDLIDDKEQYILIGNHKSYLDALVSALASKNYKKYIGKAEILHYPVLGYLLKKLYVPVQRDNKDSRKWSMGAMSKYLEDGASMVIFPEGTCNVSDLPIKEFKQGAFRLSLQLNIPIAIATYVGVADLMPRKLLSIRPGTVHVYWTKVLLPENYDNDSIDAMISDARNEMLTTLETFT